MIIFTNDTYLKKNSIKKRTKNQLLTLFGTSITHLRCIQVLSWIMRWSPPSAGITLGQTNGQMNEVTSWVAYHSKNTIPNFFFETTLFPWKKNILIESVIGTMKIESFNWPCRDPKIHPTWPFIIFAIEK